jgi:hypothetical protein
MIVVMILGVLAALVTVSLVGLLGRGGKEAYLTDQDTIHTLVSAFYSDTHAYSDDGGWNEADDHVSFHNYPIGNATNDDALDLYLGDVVDLGKYKVHKVMDASEPDADVADGDEPEASDADIRAAAIWMGLLTNGPGDGDALCANPNPDHSDYVSPLEGEFGLYLNPLPNSCSTWNYSKGDGTYTWIVGENGMVYGVFKDGANGNNWYAGFNGFYP